MPAASWLNPLPLVAILRGLPPAEAVATGKILVDAGFHILEVPLNSPQPLDSIRLLADRLGDQCLIGAGTVLRVEAVPRIAAAGGRLVVMPHADTAVIRAAKDAGLTCIPGVATPTEALAALDAGADALKLFPATQITPPVLHAWRAILPADVSLLPVGGITPDNMPDYIKAGAGGFGLGSALYKPGRGPEAIAQAARDFVDAWVSAHEKEQGA